MRVWLPLTDVKEDSPFGTKFAGPPPALTFGESSGTNPNGQSEPQVSLPPTVNALPLALTSGGKSGNAAHQAKQRSASTGSQGSARKRVASHRTSNEVAGEFPPYDGLSLRQRELEEQQQELRSSAEQDRLQLAEALRRIEYLEILVARLSAADSDEASSVKSEVVAADLDGPSDASLDSVIMAKDFLLSGRRPCLSSYLIRAS